MRSRFHLRKFGGLVAVALATYPVVLRADCSLTTTGNVPLVDLGPGLYQGFKGGLYPDGSNTRPAAHNAAGVALASQVEPLDASGNPSANGKIVMISIGMSNATQEFASKGDNAFKPRADSDPSKNPQLIIVDGAQSGQDATKWFDPNAPTWAEVDLRLAAAGVTPAQVQIVCGRLVEHVPRVGFSGGVLQAGVRAQSVLRPHGIVECRTPYKNGPPQR